MGGAHRKGKDHGRRKSEARSVRKETIEECWEETGKGPVGVDANKGDMEKLEFCCRLVAKEIKKDRREDLFAATPPLEAGNEADAMPALGQRARVMLGLWRCGSCLFSRESEEKGVRGAVRRGLG